MQPQYIERFPSYFREFCITQFVQGAIRKCEQPSQYTDIDCYSLALENTCQFIAPADDTQRQIIQIEILAQICSYQLSSYLAAQVLQNVQRMLQAQFLSISQVTEIMLAVRHIIKQIRAQPVRQDIRRSLILITLLAAQFNQDQLFTKDERYRVVEK